MNHRPARGIAVVTIVAMLMLASLAVQAPERASADVLSCGDTVTTSVKLTADIVGCFNGPAALVVGADNITIDGGGHTLSGGNVFSGILVSGHRNVRIKNVRIETFCFGIEIQDSVGISITDVHIQGTACALVSVTMSERVSLSKSTLVGSGGGGVRIETSTGVRITSSLVSGADYGFFLIEVDGARLLKNTAESTYLGNFILEDTVDSTLRLNVGRASVFAPDFFLDDGSTGNRLAGNASESDGTGGFVDESAGDGTAGTANTYQGNTCATLSTPEGLCQVQ